MQGGEVLHVRSLAEMMLIGLDRETHVVESHLMFSTLSQAAEDREKAMTYHR